MHGCCCDYDPPGLRCRSCMFFGDHRHCADMKRRMREAAEAASKPKPAPIMDTPRCDCYGSMFSHDIDCALNIARAEAAGYRLVRIGEEGD